MSAVTFAADLVRGHVLEPERLQEVVERAVAEAAAIAGADVDVVRRAICLFALRDPRLNDFPPALAAEAVLRILATLAPVRAASLWAYDDGREARRLTGIEDDGFEEPLRAAAEELLAGRTPRLGASGALVAVPVVRSGRTAGALVVLADQG
ncbi:MAG: hypothetical protein M3304_06515, partial [Actinomycetota bacterium]|nr:hypothetical protein [Actinomycetota bacterium]